MRILVSQDDARAVVAGDSEALARLRTAIQDELDSQASSLHQHCIATARGEYQEGSDNDIEVDDDAPLSVTDGGVWVGAWVWLSADLAGISGTDDA